jgi:hypothetical protein
LHGTASQQERRQRLVAYGHEIIIYMKLVALQKALTLISHYHFPEVRPGGFILRKRLKEQAVLRGSKFEGSK